MVHRHPTKAKRVTLGLYVFLACLFVLTALVGSGGYFSLHTSTDRLIFWQYHLSVLTGAVIIGGALGACGAILQVLLKNPLADAGIIGISSGSQFFGVLLLLLMSVVNINYPATRLFFFAGILGAAIVLGIFLLILSLKSQLSNITVIILLGVGISAIFSALTMLLISLSDNALLKQMIMWQFGGFSDVSWQENAVLFLALLAFSVFACKNAAAFDLFSLGEKEAALMGVNIKKLFILLMLWMSVLIASTVAVAGPIAFIGLVSPHLARALLGTNKMILLLLSSIAVGAMLLMIAQFSVMTLFYPIAIPVGIITAIIGAPFLIILVSKALSKSF